MKKMINLFVTFLLGSTSVVSAAQVRQIRGDEIKETGLSPQRIVWMSDSTGRYIKNAEVLLRPFPGQVSVNNASGGARFVSKDGHMPSILLDFGKEFYGGLKIYTGMADSNKARHLRVCLGESVTEAMSNVDINDNPQNPTNEHSMRDFTVCVPWLGTVDCGNSGFRFARIDFLDNDDSLPILYIEGRSLLRDMPEIGNFECSDPRLTEIWKTGAYTVKLNMQDYVWDGIKRDRLVWLGDMHPEVMTASIVYGDQDVVKRTLDFAKDDTPLPGWINGMSSYSLWWLIIQHDLYGYTGDSEYLRAQLPYMEGLTRQIAACIDKKGEENLDGQRFLDWPTSGKTQAIHSGLQSLTRMAMEAVGEIGRWMDDGDLVSLSVDVLSKMRKAKVPDDGNKQACALAIISGQSRNPVKDAEVILEGGPNGFSTFYGYYMLEALARTGHMVEAQKILSDYWGAMLDLGATTFWEDLDYADVGKASRIDSMVPAGKYDIHADGGAYCYKGLRLSLCHGWASGPTPWLVNNVLGVRPVEPGCRVVEVNPDLGSLEWARGTLPTPRGPLHIEIRKDGSGKLVSRIDAPDGVEVIDRTQDIASR